MKSKCKRVGREYKQTEGEEEKGCSAAMFCSPGVFFSLLVRLPPPPPSRWPWLGGMCSLFRGKKEDLLWQTHPLFNPTYAALFSSASPETSSAEAPALFTCLWKSFRTSRGFVLLDVRRSSCKDINFIGYKTTREEESKVSGVCTKHINTVSVQSSSVNSVFPKCLQFSIF